MSGSARVTAILGTYRKGGVIDSAVDEILARLMSRMVGLLKTAARLAGARKVDVLFVGLVAGQQRADLGGRARAKARRLGRRLAAPGKGQRPKSILYAA